MDARRTALLIACLLWIGCGGETYDDDAADDDSAGDDDTGSTDDDTGSSSGVMNCEQEDFYLNNCMEVDFEEFDLSFCIPVEEELTFTANSDLAWDELVNEDCIPFGAIPEPPDWQEVMMVGVASRSSGCVSHAENVWFLECGNPDQRAYAYVHAWDGECEEEIHLTTAVLVPRNTRPTHFFPCDYVF